jgi:hypothetical protein
MVLAFMAQHLWEVGAAVFGVLLVGEGLFYLIKGNRAPKAEGMSERAARAIGGLAVIIGVGTGIAAFTVDAEQPGVHGGNGWGGAAGVIILCVWVALMCGGLVFKLIRSGKHG